MFWKKSKFKSEKYFERIQNSRLVNILKKLQILIWDILKKFKI